MEPVNPDDALIEQALSVARDTKALRIARGALKESPQVFASQFGNRPAVIVEDPNTLAAEGRAVFDAFKSAGHPCFEPFIFDEPNLYAEHGFVDALQKSLSQHDAIPVAVGAGTINDLTKLASYHLNRPYMCVATAASMDGYAAYGASITIDGSKQTFDCPAPRAIVADLDVISQAPPQMNAWGYADLLAKITAGADWIIADELEVEPINPLAWSMVQDRLQTWTGDPAGIRRGDPEAIRSLLCGLMMAGFAMQAISNSRPASGAEHQFSHLWDMERATTVAHGAKVGVATVTVARIYEAILKLDSFEPIRPDETLSDAGIDALFLTEPCIAARAKQETRAKQWSEKQLQLLRERWPRLKQRLEHQLPPAKTIAQMLDAVGGPNRSEQIGISRQRLHDSVLRAYHIRRRFTVLDLVARTGGLSDCLAGTEEANVGS
jgi:glycerol-1-phosphate dehydrogenase [NAD(P)+]